MQCFTHIIITKQGVKKIMDNSFIHFKIDSELKKEFQIIALKQNKTITALLTEFIQDTVNENK